MRDFFPGQPFRDFICVACPGLKDAALRLELSWLRGLGDARIRHTGRPAVFASPRDRSPKVGGGVRWVVVGSIDVKRPSGRFGAGLGNARRVRLVGMTFDGVRRSGAGCD